MYMHLHAKITYLLNNNFCMIQKKNTLHLVLVEKYESFPKIVESTVFMKLIYVM